MLVLSKRIKAKRFNKCKRKNKYLLQGYILNIGDVLKFGNVKLKVNNIKTEGYQEKESMLLKKANSIYKGKINLNFIYNLFRLQ